MWMPVTFRIQSRSTAERGVRRADCDLQKVVFTPPKYSNLYTLVNNYTNNYFLYASMEASQENFLNCCQMRGGTIQ